MEGEAEEGEEGEEGGAVEEDSLDNTEGENDDNDSKSEEKEGDEGEGEGDGVGKSSPPPPVKKEPTYTENYKDFLSKLSKADGFLPWLGFHRCWRRCLV